MLNVFGTIYAEWNQTTTAPKSIQNFKNKKFNLIQSSINLQKPSHQNKENFQKIYWVGDRIKRELFINRAKKNTSLFKKNADNR